MSETSDDLQELIAAVALGVATDDEVERVERAAAFDPRLAAELDELRRAALGIALDVPQSDPSPELRERVMAAVAAEGRPGAPAPSATEGRSAGRARAAGPGRWRGWPAVAAGALAVAAALLVWNIAILVGDGDDPDTRRVAVEAADGSPSIGGEAIVLEGGDSAILRVSGLDEPGPGRGIEVWVLGDGETRSAGFLRQAEGGDLVAVVPDVAGAEALAVTEEPLTNRTAPTSAPLARAAL